MKGRDVFQMSPELIESIIEGMADGISIHDTNFKVLYQNRTHKGFVGEHIGEYCYKAYEKKETVCDGCPVAMSFEDNKVHTAERVVTINGEPMHFEIRSSILKSPDGNIIGAIENVRDVTKRKRAEEAMIESEERFRNLFNNMSSGVAIYDIREEGQEVVFIDMNKAGLRITNTPKEQIIGRKVQEIFQGVREMGLLEVFKLVYQTGIPEHYPSHIYHDEKMVFWADNFIYKLPGGEIVAIFDDVTAMKQAEEDLLRNEQIIASSKDMMALLDKNYIYLAVNDAYRNAFDMTRDDIVGHSVSEVFGQEFFDKVIKPHSERCLAGEEVTYCDWFEFPVYGKQYVEINYTPYIGADKKVKGFVVNGRDMTEKKKAEDELKDRTEKLERLNKAFVGRELKMVELKKEIEELRKRRKA